MTGEQAPAGDPLPAPGAPAGPGAPASAPCRRDRVLLGVFVAYAALLAVAAFAQLTGNRTLLDLFDLRRFFKE